MLNSVLGTKRVDGVDFEDHIASLEFLHVRLVTMKSLVGEDIKFFILMFSSSH